MKMRDFVSPGNFVMAGEGLPSAPLVEPAQQGVDGRPSPAMTLGQCPTMRRRVTTGLYPGWPL